MEPSRVEENYRKYMKAFLIPKKVKKGVGIETRTKMVMMAMRKG